MKTGVSNTKNDPVIISRDSPLFVPIQRKQCPVVFHKQYDVSFCGLDRLHPFDSRKWGRIYKILEERGLVTNESVVTPHAAKRKELLIAHSKRYLRSLNCPCTLAMIVEIPIVCFIPPCITNKYFLKAMRRQTGGTVAACRLALLRGWSINIGGGFHHASSDSGGGFCVYADISLALKMMFHIGLVRKVLIVDLDAHQGNGHERDFARDQRVRVLDMFNAQVYPFDTEAMESIDFPVRLSSTTSDNEYKRLLEFNLEKALAVWQPELIVYNAGTDCLFNDPLGGLNLSEECIIERDELVFTYARSRDIPIAMLTSGGYQLGNADLIAHSIINLHEKDLIELK